MFPLVSFRPASCGVCNVLTISQLPPVLIALTFLKFLTEGSGQNKAAAQPEFCSEQNGAIHSIKLTKGGIFPGCTGVSAVTSACSLALLALASNSTLSSTLPYLAPK